MGLSSELISQFAKIATNDKKEKSESVCYGKIVKDKNSLQKCVQIDGSNVCTPITTMCSANEGDRVAVLIKNHEVVVLGNISSPSATISMLTGNNISDSERKDVRNALNELRRMVEYYGYTWGTELHLAIEQLQKEISTQYLSAEEVQAINAKIENLRVEFGNIENITAKDLETANADFDTLNSYTAKFTYVSTNSLEAVNAEIQKLKATALTADQIEGKYANIDFSNIKTSTMENFYANSGLIKNVAIGNETITGELNGVTINGNLIKDDTIVADKLVLKGTNGLYYKLNTGGIKTESEQTEYNSLKGDIFMAKSIAATKISVSDLVSFGATIGGFKITTDSIYSGAKETVGNTTRGIYLDDDGQVALGDSNKYIKFFKDTDNEYKLLISGAVVQNGLKANQLVGGYYQSAAYEGQGSAGYLNIAEIKLTNNHQNSLIELKILRRGDNYVTKIYIRFANTNSSDPALEIFDISNSGVKAYIAKTSTATWNLYVEKSDSYDNVSILSCHYNGLYMGSEVITYKNTFVSSLPSGYVTSDYASGFSGYHYSQAYGFHESPSLIRGRSVNGGFDFYFKENGMRIVFDGSTGKIWRVDNSGTWTVLVG